jgi:hypothetical protein
VACYWPLHASGQASILYLHHLSLSTYPYLQKLLKVLDRGGGNVVQSFDRQEGRMGGDQHLMKQVSTPDNRSSSQHDDLQTKLCAGWCLQVKLPTVLELESRPLGAVWHRR